MDSNIPFERIATSEIGRQAGRIITAAEGLSDLIPPDVAAQRFQQLAEMIADAPDGMLEACMTEIAQLIRSSRADLSLPLLAAIEKRERNSILRIFGRDEVIKCRVAHIRRVAIISEMFAVSRMNRIVSAINRLKQQWGES